jgi:hypothetical protein
MKEFSSRRKNLGKSVRYEKKIPRIIREPRYENLKF